MEARSMEDRSMADRSMAARSMAARSMGVFNLCCRSRRVGVGFRCPVPSSPVNSQQMLRTVLLGR